MKLKCCLIGFGYFGANYARILSQHENAELVVICDLNVNNLQKAREQYPNIPTSINIDDLLRHYDFDAAIIATPLSTHYKIANELLMDGKHILCEKAFTYFPDNAASLIETAKQNNIKITVGHTFIYNSLVRHIKKLLDEKALGDILYMTFQRTGKSPIRSDCNSLYDLSTHDISMALYWLGEMPKSMMSFGKSYLQNNIEDMCFTTLEFSNNVVAHLHASWYEPIKQRKVTIVGSEKMLTFDDVAKTLIVHDGNYQHVQNIEYKEPLSEQVNDFIDSVLMDKSPMVDGQQGLDVVRVLAACQQSLKNNSEKINL